MRKVLYVSHSHPTIHPGGLEMYADELYRSMRERGEYAPVFVAKIGPPHSKDQPRDGTRFRLAGQSDPELYYFYTHVREFDLVMGTARRKELYTRDWKEFLQVQRPDVVHFQHADWLGYDMIRETRRVLPEAAIVYTLHDYTAICHRYGQMIKNETNELCYGASPRRCHQCFPKIPAETFFVRERFVKSAFELVDMFISPSEFLRQRFIEWGLPAEKIIHENNGRIGVPPLPDPPGAGRRRLIGFFGQINPFKGIDVLLEAMKVLEREEFDVTLLLRGANLEIQPPFFQKKIRGLLEDMTETVRFTGKYEQDELPGLLSAVDWVVIPSIWWENAPLVIQEAMMHRRPVICSDIGGMAEKIQDGVNGFHFTVGDPFSLADAIRRAVSSPELWDEMRSRITDPHPMDMHVARVSGIYDEALDRRRAGAQMREPVAALQGAEG